MRFAEYFESPEAPVVSFEVFPPKTDKAMQNLREVLPRLVALKPTFMTVTYGAMGTTRVKTVEIAAMIRNEFGLECASHYTCVGVTVEQIDAQIEHIRRTGIENIVALRGDPPQGQDTFEPVEGGFAHANELVAHLKAKGQFGIAVAGYPEKHIEAPDMETDLANLKRKVDAGAEVVVTQLFYDNDCYFRFVERAREIGIDVPIVPGLLPIQSYPQIRRISSMCGASIPAGLAERLDLGGDDSEAVKAVGDEWCIAQCRDLLERGSPGLHFYVLNRAIHMQRIIGALRDSEHLPARSTTIS